jgi:hypothetical protein
MERGGREVQTDVVNMMMVVVVVRISCCFEKHVAQPALKFNNLNFKAQGSFEVKILLP